MPQFEMDTTGQVLDERGIGNPKSFQWTDLDSFTQGYLEACFFTEHDPVHDKEAFRSRPARELGDPMSSIEDWEGSIPKDASFGDLAPEALEAAMRDCATFQGSTAWANWRDYADNGTFADVTKPNDTHAGRDFWYTRNGHGCGFWSRSSGGDTPCGDGDWEEPHGTALTAACEAFDEVDVYWDAEKVHFS